MRVTGYVDVPTKLERGIITTKDLSYIILVSIASQHVRGQDHVGVSMFKEPTSSIHVGIASQVKAVSQSPRWRVWPEIIYKEAVR